MQMRLPDVFVPVSLLNIAMIQLVQVELSATWHPNEIDQLEAIIPELLVIFQEYLRTTFSNNHKNYKIRKC